MKNSLFLRGWFFFRKITNQKIQPSIFVFIDRSITERERTLFFLWNWKKNIKNVEIISLKENQFFYEKHSVNGTYDQRQNNLKNKISYGSGKLQNLGPTQVRELSQIIFKGRVLKSLKFYLFLIKKQFSWKKKLFSKQ